MSDVKHKPRGLFLALLGVAGVCAVPVAIADGKAVRHLGAIEREAPGASVNICGAGAGTLGVRVSAPYRGEDLAPWVRITVEYYSTQDGAWHAAGAGGDSGWFPAGGPGTGSDTGWTFPFLAPEPGHRLLMRGIARVEWRGGRTGEASTRPPPHARSRVTEPRPRGSRRAAARSRSANAPFRRSGSARQASAVKSRGSFVMTPVTPSAARRRMLGRSSTVQTKMSPPAP